MRGSGEYGAVVDLSQNRFEGEKKFSPNQQQLIDSLDKKGSLLGDAFRHLSPEQFDELDSGLNQQGSSIGVFENLQGEDSELSQRALKKWSEAQDPIARESALAEIVNILEV